eukprot:366259-Chlamydomonas_euryale.AAC.25
MPRRSWRYESVSAAGPAEFGEGGRQLSQRSRWAGRQKKQAISNAGRRLSTAGLMGAADQSTMTWSGG